MSNIPRALQDLTAAEDDLAQKILRYHQCTIDVAKEWKNYVEHQKSTAFRRHYELINVLYNELKKLDEKYTSQFPVRRYSLQFVRKMEEHLETLQLKMATLKVKASDISRKLNESNSGRSRGIINSSAREKLTSEYLQVDVELEILKAMSAFDLLEIYTYKFEHLGKKMFELAEKEEDVFRKKDGILQIIKARCNIYRKYEYKQLEGRSFDQDYMKAAKIFSDLDIPTDTATEGKKLSKEHPIPSSVGGARRRVDAPRVPDSVGESKLIRQKAPRNLKPLPRSKWY